MNKPYQPNQFTYKKHLKEIVIDLLKEGDPVRIEHIIKRVSQVRGVQYKQKDLSSQVSTLVKKEVIKKHIIKGNTQKYRCWYFLPECHDFLSKIHQILNNE